ncbi:hypothetical protein BUV99_13445, partial [Corynebacterium diphtheriae]
KARQEQQMRDWFSFVPQYLITVDATYCEQATDHDHIAELLHDNEEFLAFVWASSAAVAKKRMVLGQCEKVMFNVGGWKKARQEQQMRDWFSFVPQYLITVDATYCEQATD